ncbi:MAG: triose-phosphate isomerase [Promethearchaeota archaeon]
MQITKAGDAVRVASEIASTLSRDGLSDRVEAFVAPSFTALHQVGGAIRGTKLRLAAQDACFKPKGAFTGETSVESLLEAGCTHVILGHSERRRIFGENDDVINQKVRLALDVGLTVVLCIGETAAERAAGRLKEVNESQLAGSLKDVTTDQLGSVVVAYEPVWAINNPYLNPGVEIKTATPEEAQGAHRLVRDWLVATYGEAGGRVPIQYGGSMKPENAAQLLRLPDVDGGLVGSASLDPNSFVAILRAAEEAAKQ